MSTATLNPPAKESIPRAALQFREVGRAAVVFAKKDSGDSRETPIAMLARSSQPIEHWYWGKVAHDFSGMKLRKENLPLDYCHDPNEIIGVAGTFVVKRDGLHVRGKLVSVFTGDRVDQITKLAAKGVPYEASIDFYGPMKLERVGENEVATCNGMEFTGPGVIVRQWILNGVAVCPLGADSNTSTRFSRSNPGPLVSLSIDATDSRAAALMRVGYSPGLAMAAAGMRFRKGRTATATGSPAVLATPPVVAGRTADDAEIEQLAVRMGNRNLARVAAGIKMPRRRW